MLNNYGFMMLSAITKPRYWEVLSILAEGPVTTSQLVDQTGFTRNEVLEITRRLAQFNLIHRPRKRRKGVEGLVVAVEPELLNQVLEAIDTWFYTIREAEAAKAAEEAARWGRIVQGLPEPKPAPNWTPVIHHGGGE